MRVRCAELVTEKVGSIAAGDTFTFGRLYYIRTDKGGDAGIGCVDLQTGALTWFGLNTEVIKVNMEVIEIA